MYVKYFCLNQGGLAGGGGGGGGGGGRGHYLL